MDEGVVEGREDTSDAKDELACEDGGVLVSYAQNMGVIGWGSLHAPSRAWGPREMFSWAGRVVFLGGIVIDVVGRPGR